MVVVGAGQAGLSSAYFLRLRGFEPESGFVVLDGAPGPGGAWQHRWPTLRMRNVHGVHDLPGLAKDPPDPDAPAAEALPPYFADYERHFDLPIHRPARVHAVRYGADDRLLVDSSAGTWATRTLINATGTWERPFRPTYPGAYDFHGRQLHTVDYRGPGEFAGQHVVVVGGGTSAVQLLAEISDVATTTWVTRRPPRFHEGPFTPEDGRAAVAVVDRAVRAGQVPGSVVGLTGLTLTPDARAARDRGVLTRLPMFDRLTPDGVAWDDGSSVRADAIVWCTGFRSAIDHLAPLRLRAPGGGIKLDGTQVVADPRIHLVGYGPSASTIGATRAGRAAVRDIRKHLGRPLRTVA